jgi:hypothetical protein
LRGCRRRQPGLAASALAPSTYGGTTGPRVQRHARRTCTGKTCKQSVSAFSKLVYASVRSALIRAVFWREPLAFADVGVATGTARLTPILCAPIDDAAQPIPPFARGFRRMVVDWVGVLSPEGGRRALPGTPDHPRHHRSRDRPGPAGVGPHVGCVFGHTCRFVFVP